MVFCGGQPLGRFFHNRPLYRLIKNIPTNIDTIPADCILETRSPKKIAASPTVTAP
jgi:hypothetical protein